jgi:hypothetical protein
VGEKRGKGGQEVEDWMTGERWVGENEVETGVTREHVAHKEDMRRRAQYYSGS